MADWDDLSGTEVERNAKLDVITDFESGVDYIRFARFAQVNSLDDLTIWETDIHGERYFTVQVAATNERLLIHVEDDAVSQKQFFTDDHFLFGT